ncbi:hypothetical protein AMAG_09277 [Allomyces macrogynus ATCC 38327]|uniref:CBS domain-containing protein n=1 Tax=Allomyces macrogynus (strain ATCC 38327) TaxID=578462 RepID=A0A0L0SPD8_ALLM3|nr:hypothetical protein AMAG_09277 [Allomyces macrogynus ATCC 38327]|eukprot:KNE64240.1 hypothetical protein AMAG_09277 [Allomyces macrogynus ATCC 38327]
MSGLLFTPEQHAVLRAAWAKYSVTDALKKRYRAPGIKPHVVTVSADVPVEVALDVLVRHNINAAPVYDASLPAFVGMVAMHDVIEYILAITATRPSTSTVDSGVLADDELDETASTTAGTAGSDDVAPLALLEPDEGGVNGDQGPATDDEDEVGTTASSDPVRRTRKWSFGSSASTEPDGLALAEVMARLRDAHAVSVACIADLSERDAFMTLPATATLEQAMDIFSKGVHRIVITPADPSTPVTPATLVGILTQSDMIQFLSDHETDHPWNDLVHLRIEDLRLCEPKPIVHVRAFQPVVDALHAMHEQRMSSVAVVDAAGRLLGNISSSDVKHMMRHLRLGTLDMPCAQFVNQVKTKQMLENDGKDIVPVIQVGPSAPLAQVMRILLVMRVHRVWCTDQNPSSPQFQAPVSVVSMTDILRVLL